MPGILAPHTLTRRRIVQLGAAATAAVMTGTGVAHARQDGGAEYTFIVSGLDYREGFEEHNSDVLMISRVNTELGTVRTVSIPRDLYVDIPGYGADKITRAFNHGYYGAGESWDGGAQMLTDTITSNFGLTIDGMVTTAFAGFERIIDAIGGVEVNNPYEVHDPNMIDPATGGMGRTWPAGVQVLNGESALNFCRTRNQDGDDGRVMRQQLVLVAILAELQKPEVVTELPALIEATRDAVDTNIPLDLQVSLITKLPNVSMDNVIFSTVEDQLWGGTLDSGMWVYQADWSTLPGNVQAFLAGV